MYKLDLDRKGRGTRGQIANICWITEKQGNSKKYLLLLHWLHWSLWLCEHNKLWKNSEKRWDYQTTLPVSWETCMQDKKQQLDVKQQTGSKLRKENIKAVYCHPADLTCICRVHHVKCRAGWVTSWHQDCLENYQQPHICIWHMHSNSTNRKGTKEPLDKGERGEWKSRLKTQHQKTKIMASGPITSWEIDGGKVETVTDFIFLCS